MITRIQVRNYKSLRYADVPMKRFHVLVGPNASGKSAFLDVLSFLHDFISKDLEYAVKKRKGNIFDLIWGRGEKEKGFEIAIEMDTPLSLLNNNELPNLVRYELAIRFNHDINEYEQSDERCFFLDNQLSSECIANYDTGIITDPQLIKVPYIKQIESTSKIEFPYELNQGTENTIPGFPSIKNRSILTTMFSEHYEPFFLWLIEILKWNISFFYIDHFVMRKECMPGSGAYLKPNGSNLPWVIDDLKKKQPHRFQEWLNHIRTALPALEDIRAFPQPEDGKCFLMFKYANIPEIPSWTISDGTLRLLALTLPAYLPNAKGIYMFEEPENGIHPQAIETVMDSMKSYYDGQVLITTHSPLILSLVKPEDILCFWNDPERGTQITTGDRHPYLKDWQGEVTLGEMFASGVFEWQPTQ